MTGAERAEFIRNTLGWVNETPETAERRRWQLEEILDKWEQDCDEAFTRGVHAGSEAA